MAVTALIVAPSASAGRTHHNTFRLRGSNGYRIRVDASPSPGSVLPPGWNDAPSRKRGEVTVTVSKQGASSYYSAPAKVTARRIKARLRGFGRIAVRFGPRHARTASRDKRSSPARMPVECIQTELTTSGVFRGRIRFRGEHGYTSVRARRAPGQVGWRSPERCTGSAHGTLLSARSGPTRFVALRDETLGGLTAFEALARERKRAVLISRTGLRVAEQSEFSFDSGLTSAHVEPAGVPFSGSADFTSPGDWTGSLAVSFAGEENLPLAGQGFTAKLKGF